MLSTLPESQNSKSLRNSLKSLSASKKHPSTSTSLKPNPFTAPGPLSVPLPASHQNKHERAAAFELTSREVTKWDAISKVMRGHGEVKGLSNRVVLPLPASDGQNKEGKTAGDLASKFVPKRGGMEDEISALLQSGEMSSSQLVAREGKGKEREEKEDQAARVGALRLERDLLFRAERKAKRVAKIKSKAFRKIKRKALAASKEGKGDLETLQQLDALDGGTRAAEELEKLERLRAKERVTLRHGGGGKWATKVGGLELEGLERDERDAAVREKEELARKLRQRIAGPDSESDEEDDGKGDGSDEAELERYAAELERLKAEENDGKLKGPYAMKFMIQAQARKEQERERELERVRKELNGEQSEDERLEEEYLFREKVDGNLGRLLFGKQADLTPKEGLIKTPPEEARQLVSDSPPPRIDILPDVPSFQARSGEGNPWLSAFNKEQPLLKPKKVHANGPQDKIEKRKGKTASALLKDATDATVEIDVKSFVEPAARASKREKGSKSAKADGAAHSINKGRKEESESEEDGEQVKFTQRELVAEAFEGDDVVAAFEAEKRMEVERDAPRTEDVTLPGWGSWTGKGVKKQKTDKKYIKNIPGIDRNERTDAKLGHVIISEKKDKRATKYLVKDLPWPYTSEAQFRKTMARNIGKEWNTAQSLRDMTRDGGEGGVTVKRGATVRPLEATI
ncbi:small-subunit processome [Atractiella rhizophila]|nr:small-subunit processome [Atractiella rhizophila]